MCDIIQPDGQNVQNYFRFSPFPLAFYGVFSIISCKNDIIQEGSTMGKFVIKETKTGVKFDLKAGNGEVIATSEVYTTEAA